MPKIPEISVGIQIERFVRFFPTGIFGMTSGGGPLISARIFQLKLAVPLLANRFFAWIRELRKERKKIMVKAIGVGWPSFIGKCHSIFLGYSHQSLTGRFGTHQASMKWVIQFLSPTHGVGSSYCIPGIATHLKVNCFFFYYQSLETILEQLATRLNFVRIEPKLLLQCI